MAAAATLHSIFPLFTRLPRELRDQIWRDALPDKVGPSLSLYKKGCWCPRRLSESDTGYDPENDENNLNFEFQHDLLDDIRFEMPLVYVNREARDLALAWVREQGVEMRPHEKSRRPLFVRPFDPKRDALYVALDQWNDFLREPEDRLSQPDLFERLVNTKSDVTRVAVPVALLQHELASLPEMFRYFFNLKALLIVIAQLDLPSADNDVKAQHRWDFESVQGGAFFWNNDRGGFDSENGESFGDEAVYRLMEEASRGLGKGLANNHIGSFEIRLVFAVRR